MSSGQLERPVTSGDLIAELAARAPEAGPNAGAWPGLTIYRFTAPAGPSWEEIQSLSLCIVAQGRKAVTVNGETYLYDPFHYLVLSSHLHFQAEILEASPSRPFLSLVLQIEPALVRRVSSDMLERRTTAFRSRNGEANAPDQPALVSALDQELLGAVLRFLRAVGTDTDRRVLAPLYLQETVYRVLQREQFARLLAIAAAEAATNPVSAVLDYVRAHLSEPLTVADMAEQVSLSPSAFAHLFRDVTGRCAVSVPEGDAPGPGPRAARGREPGRGPGLQGSGLRQRLALHQRVPGPVWRHPPRVLRHARHARGTRQPATPGKRHADVAAGPAGAAIPAPPGPAHWLATRG